MKFKVKIVKKPWGKEIWIAEDPNYLGKILIINKGHRLSRQYHRYKHETLYCKRGLCVMELANKKVTLRPGQSIKFAPRVVHRICAPTTMVELFEISTHHPKDVVRLADDYKR